MGYAGETFLKEFYHYRDYGQPGHEVMHIEGRYLYVPREKRDHPIFNVPNKIEMNDGLIQISQQDIPIETSYIKQLANTEVLAVIPGKEDYTPLTIYYDKSLDTHIVFWGVNTPSKNIDEGCEPDISLLVNVVYYLAYLAKSSNYSSNYAIREREKFRTVEPIDPNKSRPPLLWTYTTLGPLDGTIWATAVSENGTYIVAGGNDGIVYLFNRESNVPLWTYDTGDYISDVAISREYIVVSTSSGTMLVFNVNSSKPVAEYMLRNEYFFRPYLRSSSVSISGKNNQS